MIFFGLKFRGDFFLATFLIIIVALLIIPLPSFLLDILLATNISIAVVLLLSSIYVSNPLTFSAFPSLLLITTLFRLSLNVSSTRLILSKGSAGKVIESFGEFVVQGNYVVGAVIFLILTLIQFLVIAKGSERVAEVIARFMLDAMPGKQMAIDADLRLGAFTLAQAQRKREDIQLEARLFGAMDGAMKFVKGDAIAGILITLINIIAGLIIGITQLQMTVVEAVSTFTLLTIGDGLVSQIPALLISITAGLIVTRVADKEKNIDLGSQILQQLAITPSVFHFTSALLFFLGIIPGLPTIPFFVLAGVALVLARIVQKKIPKKLSLLEQSKELDREMLSIATPIILELGLSVTTQVKTYHAQQVLIKEIQFFREQFFAELGVKLPMIRVRFDVKTLPKRGIQVLVYDVPDVKKQIDPKAIIVLDTQNLFRMGFSGTQIPHPITQQPIVLLNEKNRAALQTASISYLEVAQYLMLFVQQAAYVHADKFIGIDETQLILDQLAPTHHVLIDIVIPQIITLVQFSAVLKRLVQEKISIKNIRAILEALAENANEEHDLVWLTEISRQGISRQIIASHIIKDELKAFILDDAIEDIIQEYLQETHGKLSLNLPPGMVKEILNAFSQKFSDKKERYLLVTRQEVRWYVAQLLKLTYENIIVLSRTEVQKAKFPLTSLGVIQVGE